MELRVERLWKKDKYTVGRLFVDGNMFCNTLEDRLRDLSAEKKISEQTAIPAGKYKVIYIGPLNSDAIYLVCLMYLILMVY